MRSIGKAVTSALAATALVASSVAAAAPSSPAPAQQAQQAQSPWITLTMLTPVGAPTLAGSAAAAAQSDYPPPPPRDQGVGMPPIPVLLIWAAVLAAMIYIATKGDKRGHITFPVSPG